MGRGGALAETITFNRRVVGSILALAATQGPWASPLPRVARALRRETLKQYPCCSRERLWVVEDLKGRYRNGRNKSMNEWMNEIATVTWFILFTHSNLDQIYRPTIIRKVCPFSQTRGCLINLIGNIFANLIKHVLDILLTELIFTVGKFTCNLV